MPLTRIGKPRSSLSLFRSLAAVWECDEPSGALLDCHGGLDLTDTNTVTTAAGIVGSARLFTRASTEYFSRASSAPLLGGNRSIAMFLACRPAAVNVQQGLVQKDDGAAQRSYRLYLDSSNKLWWDLLGAGTTSYGIASAMTAGNWHGVFAGYDAAADLAVLRLDGGADQTQSDTDGCGSGTAAFEVGRLGTTTNTWGGQIDQVFFWSDYCPSAAERTWLYNAGSLRSYRDLETYSAFWGLAAGLHDWLARLRRPVPRRLRGILSGRTSQRARARGRTVWFPWVHQPALRGGFAL